MSNDTHVGLSQSGHRTVPELGGDEIPVPQNSAQILALQLLSSFQDSAPRKMGRAQWGRCQPFLDLPLARSMLLQSPTLCGISDTLVHPVGAKLGTRAPRPGETLSAAFLSPNKASLTPRAYRIPSYSQPSPLQAQPYSPNLSHLSTPTLFSPSLQPFLLHWGAHKLASLALACPEHTGNSPQ